MLVKTSNDISNMHLPTRQFPLAPCYSVTDMNSLPFSLWDKPLPPAHENCQTNPSLAKNPAAQLASFVIFRPPFITFHHISTLFKQPPNSRPLGSSMV